MTTNKDIIEAGKAILGIELGSTRIKRCCWEKIIRRLLLENTVGKITI